MLQKINLRNGQSRLQTNAGEAAEILTANGIAQNMAKVLDGSNPLEIAKQVEKEKRNRIVAGAAAD
jgi:hypothetical protein